MLSILKIYNVYFYYLKSWNNNFLHGVDIGHLIVRHYNSKLKLPSQLLHCVNKRRPSLKLIKNILTHSWRRTLKENNVPKIANKILLFSFILLLSQLRLLLSLTVTKANRNFRAFPTSQTQGVAERLNYSLNERRSFEFT